MSLAQSINDLHSPAKMQNDDIEHVKMDLWQPLEGRLQILCMLLF